MTRIAQVVVVVLVVAFCFGQMALAGQNPHYKVTMVPSTQHHTGISENAADANNLYALWASFSGGPIASYATPTNSDGSEMWPCFGGGTAANTDCPSLGNPSQDFATSGVVVGAPFFTWPLSACNQTSTTTAPCGQTETWYEDDSADTTDDLLYFIQATQGTGAGTKYIVDSGQLDLVGPNPFGGFGNPGTVIIVSGDQGFGTQGNATGPNNGNCSPAFNYPLATPANPGVTYGLGSGKTCVAAVSGLVNFEAITELAKPSYKKVGSTYTVSFKKKYSVTQKWSIWLD